MNRRTSFTLVTALIALGFLSILLKHEISAGILTRSQSLPVLTPPIETTDGATPYDSNPAHIWNRMHHQFFARTGRDGKEFGVDNLDPLLWIETQYLITGPSHTQAASLLDDFLKTHAETLIADPLKRAMLQRELWAVFDWLCMVDDHATERRELQLRLVEIIKRLALTGEQIKRLPDNYNAAVKAGIFPAAYRAGDPTKSFLPPDLLQTGGPWILIGDERGRITAPVHARASPFGGRSTFLVLMRLPGGREATLVYLEQLRRFPRPMIYNSDRSGDNEPFIPNPELPQFPTGTQLTLVRRLILIDAGGNPVPTLLTEGVQIRVFRSIPEGTGISQPQASRTQDVFEFKLDPNSLLAGKSGLREVLRDEKEFMLFRAHGIDWFEKMDHPEESQSLTLGGCANCHASPGIHSMLSYSERRFQPSIHPPVFIETTIANEEAMATGAKTRQYEWGLLKGMWQAKR